MWERSNGKCRGIGYRLVGRAGVRRIGGIEVCSICENEICAFDLRAGAAVGSITDTAMKK